MSFAHKVPGSSLVGTQFRHAPSPKAGARISEASWMADLSMTGRAAVLVRQLQLSWPSPVRWCKSCTYYIILETRAFIAMFLLQLMACTGRLCI